jgi:hypothetical protein
VPDLSLAYAVIALVVLVVGGIVVAGQRLRSFQLSGQE